MKEYNFCNNCGKYGHLFHQCKNPITSVGIIVFHIDNANSNNIEYLLIRRKDSLGYVDFMRGKYPVFNKRYLLNIISEMTINEKNKLLNNDFDTLWKELWGDYIGIQYRCEEKISREKFTTLKIGINLPNENYNLKSLIDLSTEEWDEPEWGFAKGRRNYLEKDLTCALREFEEETGYNKSSIKLIHNLIPLEEIFTGSNYKSYKHKYFLGFMNNNNKPQTIYQTYEISKIEWVSINTASEYLRDYNIEKKNILVELNKLLKTNKLYI